jgi:hypothetical protein
MVVRCAAVPAFHPLMNLQSVPKEEAVPLRAYVDQHDVMSKRNFRADMLLRF